MIKITPAILQLQADAVNPAVSVTATLRLAKVIATKLGQNDALGWIDRELSGYIGLRTEDLPSFRLLRGTPKAFDPYRGWEAILFNSASIADKCSIAPMGMPIGTIEEDLKKQSGSTQGMFPYPPEAQVTIRKAIGLDTHVAIFLEMSQIVGIVEAARNLVLDWSLELEKAGILGDDMRFTVEEKRESSQATQTFFIQNAGVIGNVSDTATVTNTQTAGMNISSLQLEDFLDQTKKAFSLLPADAQAELKPILGQLETEANKNPPNDTRVRYAVQSIKTICEQAAGNLAAMGILGLLSRMFGV